MVTHVPNGIDIRSDIEKEIHLPQPRVALPTDGTAHTVIDLREMPAHGLADDLELHPYRTARLLSSDTEILAARRLQADVFVASGFISAADVTADGIAGTGVDPWAGSSEYFAVMRDGAAVATARQITLPDSDRLPALSLGNLADNELHRIHDLPSKAVAEISGLARRRDALSSDVVAVYVSMWQESMRREHQVWVMAVDVRVFDLLQNAMCGKAIRKIGAAQHYMGSSVVPAVIWFDELNPEHLRLADLARGTAAFPTLLPRLFPRPSVEGR
jgi:hypothetical protein